MELDIEIGLRLTFVLGCEVTVVDHINFDRGCLVLTGT